MVHVYTLAPHPVAAHLALPPADPWLHPAADHPTAGRAPLRLRLEGGAASSWLPLLALALLAAADFAAQAALPAVAAALRLWSGGFLPGGVRNVLDFLGNVAGEALCVVALRGYKFGYLGLATLNPEYGVAGVCVSEVCHAETRRRACVRGWSCRP